MADRTLGNGVDGLDAQLAEISAAPNRKSLRIKVLAALGLAGLLVTPAACADSDKPAEAVKVSSDETPAPIQLAEVDLENPFAVPVAEVKPSLAELAVEAEAEAIEARKAADAAKAVADAMDEAVEERES